MKKMNHLPQIFWQNYNFLLFQGKITLQKSLGDKKADFLHVVSYVNLFYYTLVVTQQYVLTVLKRFKSAHNPLIIH